MRTLSKYLLRELGFIFLNISLSGILVYLLFDFLDRVDEFISSKVSLTSILLYFTFKIPMILSQIMPGIFFISIIILFSILYNRNEIIAILSGGIYFRRLIFFILSISVFISFLHFAVIQEAGSYGMFKSAEMWKKYVRNKELIKNDIYNKWLIDKDKVIHFERFNLSTNKGTSIKVYEVDFSNNKILRYITGDSFVYNKERIIIDKAWIFAPHSFSKEQVKQVNLKAQIDFKSLATLSSDLPQEALSFTQLTKIIEVFRKNGISVEELLATWYGKYAYSFSIIILSILGVIIVYYLKNVYKSLLLGLGLIFSYYTLFVIGSTLAKKGVLFPFLGGWLANIIFMFLILPYLFKILKE